MRMERLDPYPPLKSKREVLSVDVSKQLQAPFPAKEIEFRVQSCGVSNGKPWAMVLAYVQARAIQRRLDDVFGWDGWTDEYRSTDGNMICRLGVRTDNGWIYKENGASETQVEAFKGGISGAFKRVAASGYGIGRYLYDLTESFAQCQLEKPSNMDGWNKAKTKDNKMIYWRTPTLPAWALPQDQEPRVNSNIVGEIKTQWMAKGFKEANLNAQLKKLYGKTLTTLTEDQAADFLSKLGETA